ncbi:MAG: putative bifunctional diguanylate cyclase/phosphodiesterase [Solirubrobacteraceae bacterium]
MSDSQDASPVPTPDGAGDGLPGAPGAPGAPVAPVAPAQANGGGAASTGKGPAAGARTAAGRLAGVPRARALIALVCVALGVVASILGARAVAHSDARGARQSFQRSSAGVATAVKLALAHEEDLLTSAGTYLSRNSLGTPAEFSTWVKWARLLRTHPELESLGLIALVRDPELASFQARLQGQELKPPAGHGAAALSASTAASAAAAQALQIHPGAGLSYHCLALSVLSRSAAVKPSAGLDYCAQNAALLATRDTTDSIYTTIPAAGGPALEVLAPAYRGSVPPKTSLGRRSAFAGWLREVFAPQVLLAQALHGAPIGAARLRHKSGATATVFAVGTPPAGGQSAAGNLRSGWTLRTFAAPVSTGVLQDGDALALLIVGLLLSVAAGALVAFSGRPAAAAAVPPAPPAPREDLYDALTGLPNRGLTLDRAERMLARAGRNSAIMVGALFIDIDWFKDVNEKLGQEAGDQLLKIVAERLEGVVRTHDTVGRYGGDEFVVIVESAVKGMRLDSLARRIIEALHKPVELEGFGPSFCLTASIGVAFGRYATPEDLLRDAHMALFAAKAAGKDRYTLFNANMRAIIEGRGVLEVELNTALQEGQFSLLYQPVYDLQTHKVVGLEALVRWEHPTKGEVPPSDFIPLAEESGLIVPIGRWVLEEACVRAAAWNVSGHRVGIAVKVSAQQLDRDGFVTDVLRALQQSGLDPSLLALEIAETTVMADKAAAARRMEQLKQLGVRIAIDDFGSGYAYRSDLQQMPIDFLKVDRGSLAASEDEDYRSWLLEAILVFGRDLSLTVIAKGVEDQEQMLALQAMGCTMAQGYFLGEPRTADTVEGLFVVPAPAGTGVVPPPPGEPASPLGDSPN